MNDLIDRDAVKSSLCDSCLHKGKCLPPLCGIHAVIDEQPAVNRWIPCNERLPENRECVAFTINRGCPKIGCGYRIHSERGGLLLTRWFDKLSGLNFSDYDVTAWMPMPDAYEPPKEGDNDA